MREGCAAILKCQVSGDLRLGSMTRNTIKPPGELGDYGLRLWRSITSLYELSPAEFELLWQACATADLIGALQDEFAGRPCPGVRPRRADGGSPADRDAG